MIKKKICIIDYEIVNIASIENAIKYLKYDYEILKKPKNLDNFSHMILPGVGSFKKGMEKLKENNWSQEIIKFVEKSGFLLGICLGMQLLFERSFEETKTNGLGLFKGELKLFDKKNLPLPHIGFNLVNHNNSKIWKNIENPSPFYFVHSYRLKNFDIDANKSLTNYGGNFISFIEKKNIFGAQFHPEKSHSVGLQLLKNFFELNNDI